MDFRTFLEVFTDKELEDYYQGLIDCLDKPNLGWPIRQLIGELKSFKDDKFNIAGKDRSDFFYLIIRSRLGRLISFANQQHPEKRERILDVISCFKEKMNHPMFNLDSPDFGVAIDRLDDEEDVEYNTIKLLQDKMNPFVEYLFGLHNLHRPQINLPMEVNITLITINDIFQDFKKTIKRDQVAPALAQIKIELEKLEKYVDGLIKNPSTSPLGGYIYAANPPFGTVYQTWANINSNSRRSYDLYSLYTPQNLMRAITLLKRIIDNPNVRRI